MVGFSHFAPFGSPKPFGSIYYRAMQDEVQKRILDAFFVILRPIAKILLRYGIGFREFAEAAKLAFVDVASAEYGIRGRPTNTSRIAVMTGLTRKEVRRLRDSLESDQCYLAVKTTPMTEVLHSWFSDAEFLDSDGRPSVLPFAGERRSFSRIVKRFGGDVPPGAMRTELKRVGAIEEDQDGNLRVLKRSFRPDGDHDALILSLLHGVYPYISTVVHNTDPATEGSRWKQRIAFSQKVRAEDVSRLRRISNDRIAEFTQAVDDLLMAYESLHDEDVADQKQQMTVAIGAFYFEERDKNMRYKW